MAKTIIIFVSIIVILFIVIEVGLPIYVESPLKSGDFYSSLPKDVIQQRQAEIGLQIASGTGWAHLAWIADPDQETYIIEQQKDGQWVQVTSVSYGSYLVSEVGEHHLRVSAQKSDGSRSVLGEATLVVEPNANQVYVPSIEGQWQPLFLPDTYANDHTVFFNDVLNKWQVISITSENQQGDYNLEKHFAVGYSDGPDFPPATPIRESEQIVDTGQLAWAPHAIKANDKFYLFWSPHTFYQMESSDGKTWDPAYVSMQVPFHKFFRDPMVMKVADNQWILYTTAKGETGKSRVDLYQSFNLKEWQYIGTALDSGSGSERNSPFASTESPFVFQYEGRYYLSVTYNNETLALYGLLLPLRIWPNPASYNETLVFTSPNPYDFGVYYGRNSKSQTYLTQLETHAPEYIQTPQGNWYITTAGWPWIASLTKGEIAVAALRFTPKP